MNDGVFDLDFFMQNRQAYICFDVIYACLSLKNAKSTTLFSGIDISILRGSLSSRLKPGACAHPLTPRFVIFTIDVKDMYRIKDFGSYVYELNN
jgi:hypothetical protein